MRIFNTRTLSYTKFFSSLLICSSLSFNTATSSELLREDAFEKQVQKSVQREISWDEIRANIEYLSSKLKSKKWKGILCITGGGLTPTHYLAKKLEIKLIETLCISSYENFEKKKESVIHKMPQLEMEGEGWLVVDDIADHGDTFEIVRKQFPKAYNTALFAKPNALEKGVVDLYGEKVEQKTWVVFPWEKLMGFN